MNKSTIPVVVALAAAAAPIQAQAADLTKAQLKINLSNVTEELMKYATPVQQTYMLVASEIEQDIDKLGTAEATKTAEALQDEINQLAADAEEAQAPYTDAEKKAKEAKETADRQLTETNNVIEKIEVKAVKDAGKQDIEEAKTAYNEAIANKDIANDLDDADAVKTAAETYEAALKKIADEYPDKDSDAQAASASYYEALSASLETASAALEAKAEAAGTYYFYNLNTDELGLKSLVENTSNLAQEFEKENTLPNAITEEKNAKFEEAIGALNDAAEKFADDALALAKDAAKAYSDDNLKPLGEEQPYAEPVEGDDDYIKDAKNAANAAWTAAVAKANIEDDAYFTEAAHKTVETDVENTKKVFDNAQALVAATTNTLPAYTTAKAQYEELNEQLNETTLALSTLKAEKKLDTTVYSVYNKQLTKISAALQSFDTTNEENYKGHKYEEGTADEDYTALQNILNVDGVGEVTVDLIKQVLDDAQAANTTVAGYQDQLNEQTEAIVAITSEKYATQAKTLKTELNQEAGKVQSAINTLKEDPTNTLLQGDAQTAIDTLKASIDTAIAQLKAYTEAAYALALYKADHKSVDDKIIVNEEYESENKTGYDAIVDDKKEADRIAKELEEYTTELEEAFKASPRTCDTTKDNIEKAGYTKQIADLDTKVEKDMADYWTWMTTKGDVNAYKQAMTLYNNAVADVDAKFGAITSSLDWSAEKKEITDELDAILAEINKHDTEKHAEAEGSMSCLNKLKGWNIAINDQVEAAKELVAEIAALEKTNAEKIAAVNALKGTDENPTIYAELKSSYKNTVDTAIQKELDAIKACYKAKDFSTYESNVAGVEKRMYNQRLRQENGLVNTALNNKTKGAKTLIENATDESARKTEYSVNEVNECNNAYKTYSTNTSTKYDKYEVAEYETVKAEIDALLYRVNAIVPDAKANAETYRELQAQNKAAKTAWATNYSQVGALYAEKEFEGALALYQGELDGIFEILVAQDGSIKDAWNNGKALKYQFEKTETDVEAVYTAAAANKQAYISQSTVSIPVLTAVADPAVEGSEDGAYTAARKTINELLKYAKTAEAKDAAKLGDTDLENVKTDMIDVLPATALEKCNAGESVDYNTYLNKEISNITAEIRKIVNTAQGTFDEEVEAWNKTTQEAFDEAFKTAITEYNDITLKVAEYASYQHAKDADGVSEYEPAIKEANDALFPYAQKLQDAYAKGLADFSKVDRFGYIDRTQKNKAAVNTLKAEIDAIFNTFLTTTESIAESHNTVDDKIKEIVEKYYTPVESYDKASSARKKFKDAAATKAAVKKTVDKAVAANTLAQVLDQVLFTDIATIESEYKNAGNEAAKVEADAFVVTQEKSVTSYSNKKYYLDENKKKHTYSGSILEAYEQALDEQSKIVENAKAEVTRTYGTVELQAELDNIKALFASMAETLATAKDTADEAVKKNITDKANKAKWVTFNEQINEQKARLEEFLASTEYDEENVKKDSQIVHLIGEEKDEEGEPICKPTTAWGNINKADKDNDDLLAAGYDEESEEWKNLPLEINKAKTLIDEVIKIADELQKEFNESNAIFKADKIKTAAQALIPAYNRAAANNPNAADTDDELTVEISAIYKALTAIITDCSTTDAEEAAAALEKHSMEDVENLANRIEDADTEFRAYNELTAALAKVESALEAVAEKFVIEDTEVLYRLNNMDADALETLAAEGKTMSENLYDDHAKNRCGKEGSKATMDKIKELDGKVSNFSEKVDKDIKDIQVAIANEAMTVANEDAYTAANEALLKLWNEETGKGRVPNVDKYLLNNYPNVAADFNKRIEAQKTAVNEAITALNAIEPQYDNDGYLQALDVTEAQNASTTINNALDQIKKDAKNAQAQYESDKADLEKNIIAMKNAYNEIKDPEKSTKAEEIANTRKEIEEDIDAIDIDYDDCDAPSVIILINSKIDAVNEKITALAKLVETSAFVPGDITGTGEVDGSDITAILNLILHKTTEDEMSEEAKKAADMDGDGIYTVADLIQINNIYLYGNPAGKSASPAKGAAYATSTLSMDIEGSVMNVALNGEKPYSAIQMDITMPNGVGINEVSYAGKSDKVMSGVNQLENGTYRVLFYAMDGSQVNISSAIASLQLVGEGNGFITIDNIMASTMSGDLDNIEGISAAQAIVTGIDAAEVSGDNSSIFSINGMASKTLQKGINIVKTAAGKIKKVLVK